LPKNFRGSAIVKTCLRPASGTVAFTQADVFVSNNALPGFIMHGGLIRDSQQELEIYRLAGLMP
jgi:hypothetical protein